MASVDPGRRQPRYFGAGDEAGAQLAGAVVAVIGCGSIGLAAALHLARLGIGTLMLIDRGRYKAESILTHPLPRPAIDQPKAEYTGAAIGHIAPAATTMVYQRAFQDLPLATLLQADFVLLAVDNLETEIAVGQRCLNLGRPILQCSVGGSLLVAQLRTFTGDHHGTGSCPACQFTAEEWRQVAAEANYSCAGDGRVIDAAGIRTPTPTPTPTRSPAALCSLAAELGVHRILRSILDLGARMVDQLVEYRGYVDELTTTPLRRRPDCPINHSRWQTTARDGTADLRAVIRQSGRSGPCTVYVDGAPFVAAGACARGCGASPWRTIERFLGSDEDLPPCDQCHGPLRRSPHHTHDRIPAAAVSDATAIPNGRAVVVQDAAGHTTLLVPDSLGHDDIQTSPRARAQP